MPTVDEWIGTVYPGPRDFTAKCGGCEWSHTYPTAGEAERALQGHDRLVHPVPIAVYRLGASQC